MRRHRYLVIGVLAVAAAVANVILVRLPDSRPPLVIDSLDAQAADDGNLDVGVTVSNPLDRPTGGRLWWLLATPGDGSEWDRRVYQSSVRSFEVPPGRQARLEWSEANPVPGGSYVVSAWVHVPGRNGYVHGDGRVATNLRIEIPTGALLRARPPSTELSIDDLDVSVAPGRPGLLTARVTVGSTTGETRRAHVHLALSPASGAGDRLWWRVPTVWASPSATVDLSGAAVQSVDITTPWPEGASGQYAVRAVLVDLVPQRDGPLDEVALPVPLSAEGRPAACPGKTFCPPGVYNPLGARP